MRADLKRLKRSIESSRTVLSKHRPGGRRIVRQIPLVTTPKQKSAQYSWLFSLLGTTGAGCRSLWRQNSFFHVAAATAALPAAHLPAWQHSLGAFCSGWADHPLQRCLARRSGGCIHRASRGSGVPLHGPQPHPARVSLFYVRDGSAAEQQSHWYLGKHGNVWRVRRSRAAPRAKCSSKCSGRTGRPTEPTCRRARFGRTKPAGISHRQSAL